MEVYITNIANVLKHCPKGIKLYSPIFGVCFFNGIVEKYFISVKTLAGKEERFNYDGTYSSGGEIMLFPSKFNKDWNHFFTKGDVLIGRDFSDIFKCIFVEWADDNYTEFRCKYLLKNETDEILVDAYNRDCGFFLRCAENVASDYITKVEKMFDGKLNPLTLEIEKEETQKTLSFTKEGEFKPFDKVIVRWNDETSFWRPTLFAMMDLDHIGCYLGVDGNVWDFCLPYNEETARLIGTTDNWEG